MKKTLIIAPHGDDEVLGLGGLITKKIAAGEYVHVAYVAVDSNGDKTRLREIEAVVDFLGISGFSILFPGADGRLDTFSDVDIVTKFDKLISFYEPDMVFLPYKSHHQDHVKVYNCGLAACRIRESFFVPFVALYEYPFVGQTIIQIEGGKAYVDISNEIEKKVEAFYLYRSQIRMSPSPLNSEGIKALAKIRGLESGSSYAEMFYIQRMVL